MSRSLGLLLGSLLLTGCGSDSTAFNAEGGGIAPVPGKLVAGVVQADTALVGAHVTVTRLDGTPLAETDTGPGGVFYVTLDRPEVGFQVTARPPAGDPRRLDVLQAEYDSLEPQAQGIVVNPLTTLAAVHHRLHPEFSLAQSQARVAAGLGIVNLSGRQMPIGIWKHPTVPENSTRAAFSSHRFVQRTSAGLPATALAEQIVARLDSGQSVPDFQGEVYQGNQNAEITDLAKILAGGLVGVGLSPLGFGALGAPAEQLIGWELGATGVATDETTRDTIIILQALQLIYNALVSISNEIKALSDQIAVDFTRSTYATQATSLVAPLSRLSAAVSDYENMVARSTPIDPVTAQNVTAPALSANQADLTQIGNQLVGTPDNPGMILLARQLINATTQLPTQSVGVDHLFGTVDFYAARLTRAVHLVVAGYHCSNPVNYREATLWYDQYCQYVAQQRSLLPFVPVNQQVVADPSRGRMWYRASVRCDNRQAQQVGWLYSAAFPYTGWRLASSADLQALFQGRSDLDFRGLGFPGAVYSGVYGTSDGNALYEPATGTRYSIGWVVENPGIKADCLYVCDLNAQSDPRLGLLTGLAIQGTPPNLRCMGTFAGVPVDISDDVLWQSSNNLTARIQNFPSVVNVSGTNTSAAGRLDWWSPGNVTITATRIDGQTGRILNATANFSRTDLQAPGLTALSITPYGLTLNSLTPVTIFARGSLVNGDGVDLSTNVTWSTSIPQAVVNITNVAQLTLTGRPTVNAFNVTARFGGVNATQQFYVNF